MYQDSGLQNAPAKKVGWVCRYTPEEVIRAAGFTPYRLLPRPDNDTVTDRLLPPTLCPYVRQVAHNLERGAYGEIQGLVLVNSCNAMLHLYSVLREQEGFFVLLLDLPRKKGKAAEAYLAHQLSGLAESLSRFGEPVTFRTLRQAMSLYHETKILWERLLKGRERRYFDLSAPGQYRLALKAATWPREQFNRELAESNLLLPKGENGEAKGDGSPYVLLTGAPPAPGLVDLLAESRRYALLMDNCSSGRYQQKILGAADPNGASNLEDLYRLLARAYLEQPACPRQFCTSRENFYRNLVFDPALQGVIFHDLNFCDLSHYDYLFLQSTLASRGLPLLKLKTELGQQDLGQVQTRVEAFLEMLSAREAAVR